MMQGVVAREHIYLYSRRAAGQLLSRFGFGTVKFLPARFEYDMYLVAARHTLLRDDWEAVAAKLITYPEGRMKLAWLDLLREFEALQADSANRLEQIFRLHQMLRESEVARKELQSQMPRHGTAGS
jgi:hypothetical protein